MSILSIFNVRYPILAFLQKGLKPIDIILTSPVLQDGDFMSLSIEGVLTPFCSQINISMNTMFGASDPTSDFSGS